MREKTKKRNWGPFVLASILCAILWIATVWTRSYLKIEAEHGSYDSVSCHLEFVASVDLLERHSEDEFGRHFLDASIGPAHPELYEATQTVDNTDFVYEGRKLIETTCRFENVNPHRADRNAYFDSNPYYTWGGREYLRVRANYDETTINLYIPKSAFAYDESSRELTFHGTLELRDGAKPRWLNINGEEIEIVTNEGE
ncbi:MAG: hypothetical protein NUW37_18470 [Planctomycetes bacterium]|nr:hypothetical protein [Planctomycetota bacterium]